MRLIFLVMMRMKLAMLLLLPVPSRKSRQTQSIFPRRMQRILDLRLRIGRMMAMMQTKGLEILLLPV